MDVTRFYDNYVTRQTAIGINERHHAILGWLRRFGLRSDHSVLELGCGVGTLTQLVAQAVPNGSVFAADLSPKSIEAAKRRLARFANVRFLAGDVLTADIPGRYDVVVLPDVIEHIPLVDHSRLFARVASWVVDDGFVLLHYPNPHFLEWCHVHNPQGLQIIDQPVHADTLLGAVYPYGLYLDYLERYSIWIEEGDYVVAVLRPSTGVGTFTHLPERAPSLIRRGTRRLLRISRRTLRTSPPPT